MPRRAGLRARLLSANLVTIFAALGSVVVAVSFVGPGYFAQAMGHAPNDPQGQLMDAATLAAFGEAIGLALVVASLVALPVAVVVSLAVSTPIARPIARLAAAAQRIASGGYAERVPSASNDEIGDLAESFNSMASSLESVERRRLQLVGDVAHELRTPLATLDGYLEGLEDEVIEPGSETWHLLRGETARLRRLVDDLQDLWRAEAKQLELRREEVDAAALVRSTLERWRSIASEGEVELRAEIEPDPVHARVDGDRVRQILDNYLSNAIRHAPATSTVTVRVRRAGGSVVIAVHDEGSGLSAEQREMLFERFYRVDRARSRTAGGAGIGLAIVRALAEAMGGRAWAESPGVGRGATFHVALPAGS